MTRSLRVTCAVLALALLAATPATDSLRRSEIDALLGRLTDCDSSVRAAARSGLMGLPASDLPLLRACVIAHPPRPAQADALREVVVHVLTRDALQKLPSSGQPYIGVQSGPPLDPPAVDEQGEVMPTIGAQVVAVLPGAPAARELQAGDVILGVDVPNGPPSWLVYGEQLREFVMANPPGTAMTFLVRRAGREMRITIVPDLRPAAGEAGFGNDPNWMANATMILAANAQLEANRIFDEQWAKLPGVTP